jgi:hypothetical protein
MLYELGRTAKYTPHIFVCGGQGRWSERLGRFLAPILNSLPIGRQGCYFEIIWNDLK